jgi:hypothetical protein
MAIRVCVCFVILLFFPLLLTGCITLPDPETSQENNLEIISDVTGQSFVARRPHLNGLTLWVKRDPTTENQQAWITARLYSSLQQASQGLLPLYNTHISIRSSGSISISFPPLEGGAGQEYYLDLIPSDSSVQLQGQNLDAYAGGQAYMDGLPLDADLAFRTSYHYDIWALLGDLAGIVRRVGLLLPLALTLMVPGWLALDLSGSRRRFDGGEQVAISAGLSLAIISILMLWSSTLEISWSRPGVMVVSILLGIIMLWRVFRHSRTFHFGWPGLALGVVFVVTLIVRIVMVRDLVAPAWVDPVHHALITRLTMDSGLFPESYSPYLELGSTVYHAGYHSTQAVFLWLSGLDLPEGMLIYGQVLNGATIFSVYLLTKTLTGDRRAALLAAWISGLFTPMPAYYVSWGRYTQLAGLLILPVPLAFLKLAFDKPSGNQDLGETTVTSRSEVKNDEEKTLTVEPLRLISTPELNWGALNHWGLACLSAGGLLIVHYRVAAFLGSLVLAYFIGLFIGRRHLKMQALFGYLLQLTAGGFLLLLGMLLLSLPWMAEVIPDLLVPAFSPNNVVAAEPFADFSWRFLVAGMGTYTFYLAGTGVAFGLLSRKRFIITTFLWVSLLFTLANLGALGLPGGQIINNTSVSIMLFMPIAMLGGYALSCMIRNGKELLTRSNSWSKMRYPLWISLLGVALVITFFGARSLLPLLNQSTYLFRAADRPALSWIEKNIPQGETILINPFNWGYGICAGADGGAWISALSGQPTMPPPVIYGFGSIKEIQRVNELCSLVLDNGSDPDQLWELMRSAGIKYIYTGLRGGPISSTNLHASALFDTIYAKDGAYVFQTLGW